MPDEDRKQLNPQIAKAEIGRRNLRNIEIFPLSVGDQLSMTSIIGEAVALLDSSGGGDIEMAGVLLQILKDNVPLILGFVIDDEKENVEELLKDITNDQAIKIAEIVFEQNFASLVKKVQGLFEKVNEMMSESSLSKRPSPQSVKSTDTDLTTSIEENSETVDLQSDK